MDPKNTKPIRIKFSSLFLKSTALVLLAAFIFHDFSFAATLELPSRDLSHNPFILKVPDSIAKISEVHKGRVPKLLIHIQDAHTNLSAQENLSKVLEELIKKHGLKTVFVEGGTKDDSLSFLRLLADNSTRQQVAKKYLLKGELNGAEYLNITSDYDMTLQGVEDKTLYQKNLKEYASVVKEREQSLSYLEELKKRTNSLKRRLYPKDILSLDDFLSRFHQKEEDFTKYHQILFDYSDKLKINLLGYPHFLSLKTLKDKEQRINFQKATQEQQSLLEKLDGTVEGFISSVQTLKDQSSTSYSFYESILKRAQANKIDLTQYPNLLLYTDYLKTFDSVDLDKLLDETKQIEDQIFQESLSNQDAFYLHEIDQYLTNLKDLFSLQITNQDYSKYESKQKDVRFNTIVFLAFLNKTLYHYKQYAEILRYLPILDENKKKAQSFYTTAKERDGVFLTKALKQMSAKDINLAVLLTGGYHTPNLKRLMKEQGISYIVLTPKVNQETNHQRYERLLLSQLGQDSPLHKTRVNTHKDNTLILEAIAERHQGSYIPLNAIRRELTSQGAREPVYEMAGARMAQETPREKIKNLIGHSLTDDQWNSLKEEKSAQGINQFFQNLRVKPKIQLRTGQAEAILNAVKRERGANTPQSGVQPSKQRPLSEYREKIDKYFESSRKANGENLRRMPSLQYSQGKSIYKNFKMLGHEIYAVGEFHFDAKSFDLLDKIIRKYDQFVPEVLAGQWLFLVEGSEDPELQRLDGRTAGHLHGIGLLLGVKAMDPVVSEGEWRIIKQIAQDASLSAREVAGYLVVAAAEKNGATYARQAQIWASLWTGINKSELEQDAIRFENQPREITSQKEQAIMKSLVRISGDETFKKVSRILEENPNIKKVLLVVGEAHLKDILERLPNEQAPASGARMATVLRVPNFPIGKKGYLDGEEGQKLLAGLMKNEGQKVIGVATKLLSLIAEPNPTTLLLEDGKLIQLDDFHRSGKSSEPFKIDTDDLIFITGESEIIVAKKQGWFLSGSDAWEREVLPETAKLQKFTADEILSKRPSGARMAKKVDVIEFSPFAAMKVVKFIVEERFYIVSIPLNASLSTVQVSRAPQVEGLWDRFLEFVRSFKEPDIDQSKIVVRQERPTLFERGGLLTIDDESRPVSDYKIVILLNPNAQSTDDVKITSEEYGKAKTTPGTGLFGARMAEIRLNDMNVHLPELSGTVPLLTLLSALNVLPESVEEILISSELGTSTIDKSKNISEIKVNLDENKITIKTKKAPLSFLQAFYRRISTFLAFLAPKGSFLKEALIIGLLSGLGVAVLFMGSWIENAGDKTKTPTQVTHKKETVKVSPVVSTSPEPKIVFKTVEREDLGWGRFKVTVYKKDGKTSGYTKMEEVDPLGRIEELVIPILDGKLLIKLRYKDKDLKPEERTRVFKTKIKGQDIELSDLADIDKMTQSHLKGVDDPAVAESLKKDFTIGEEADSQIFPVKFYTSLAKPLSKDQKPADVLEEALKVAFKYLRGTDKTVYDNPNRLQLVAALRGVVDEKYPEWVKLAKEQEKLAASSDDPFPLYRRFGVKREDPDLKAAFDKYWALYYVGVIYFLETQAYREFLLSSTTPDYKKEEYRAKFDKAMQDVLTHFPHAQGYDPEGFVWQVWNSALFDRQHMSPDALKKLKDGGILDYERMNRDLEKSQKINRKKNDNDKSGARMAEKVKVREVTPRSGEWGVYLDDQLVSVKSAGSQLVWQTLIFNKEEKKFELRDLVSAPASTSFFADAFSRGDGPAFLLGDYRITFLASVPERPGEVFAIRSVLTKLPHGRKAATPVLGKFDMHPADPSDPQSLAEAMKAAVEDALAVYNALPSVAGARLAEQSQPAVRKKFRAIRALEQKIEEALQERRLKQAKVYQTRLEEIRVEEEDATEGARLAVGEETSDEMATGDDLPPIISALSLIKRSLEMDAALEKISDLPESLEKSVDDYGEFVAALPEAQAPGYNFQKRYIEYLRNEYPGRDRLQKIYSAARKGAMQMLDLSLETFIKKNVTDEQLGVSLKEEARVMPQAGEKARWNNIAPYFETLGISEKRMGKIYEAAREEGFVKKDVSELKRQAGEQARWNYVLTYFSGLGVTEEKTRQMTVRQAVSLIIEAQKKASTHLGRKIAVRLFDVAEIGDRYRTSQFEALSDFVRDVLTIPSGAGARLAGFDGLFEKLAELLPAKAKIIKNQLKIADEIGIGGWRTISFPFTRFNKQFQMEIRLNSSGLLSFQAYPLSQKNSVVTVNFSEGRTTLQVWASSGVGDDYVAPQSPSRLVMDSNGDIFAVVPDDFNPKSFTRPISKYTSLSGENIFKKDRQNELNSSNYLLPVQFLKASQAGSRYDLETIWERKSTTGARMALLRPSYAPPSLKLRRATEGFGGQADLTAPALRSLPQASEAGARMAIGQFGIPDNEAKLIETFKQKIKGLTGKAQTMIYGEIDSKGVLYAFHNEADTLSPGRYYVEFEMGSGEEKPIKNTTVTLFALGKNKNLEAAENHLRLVIRQFADRLNEAIEQENESGARMAENKPDRRKFLAVAGIATAAVAGGVGLWTWLSRGVPKTSDRSALNRPEEVIMSDHYGDLQGENWNANFAFVNIDADKYPTGDLVVEFSPEDSLNGFQVTVAWEDEKKIGLKNAKGIPISDRYLLMFRRNQNGSFDIDRSFDFEYLIKKNQSNAKNSHARLEKTAIQRDGKPIEVFQLKIPFKDLKEGGVKSPIVEVHLHHGIEGRLVSKFGNKKNGNLKEEPTVFVNPEGARMAKASEEDKRLSSEIAKKLMEKDPSIAGTDILLTVAMGIDQGHHSQTIKEVFSEYSLPVTVQELQSKPRAQELMALIATAIDELQGARMAGKNVSELASVRVSELKELTNPLTRLPANQKSGARLSASLSDFFQQIIDLKAERGRLRSELSGLQQEIEPLGEIGESALQAYLDSMSAARGKIRELKGQHESAATEQKVTIGGQIRQEWRRIAVIHGQFEKSATGGSLGQVLQAVWKIRGLEAELESLESKINQLRSRIDTTILKPVGFKGITSAYIEDQVLAGINAVAYTTEWYGYEVRIDDPDPSVSTNAYQKLKEAFPDFKLSMSWRPYNINGRDIFYIQIRSGARMAGVNEARLTYLSKLKEYVAFLRSDVSSYRNDYDQIHGEHQRLYEEVAQNRIAYIAKIIIEIGGGADQVKSVAIASLEAVRFGPPPDVTRSVEIRQIEMTVDYAMKILRGEEGTIPPGARMAAADFKEASRALTVAQLKMRQANLLVAATGTEEEKEFERIREKTLTTLESNPLAQGLDLFDVTKPIEAKFAYHFKLQLMANLIDHIMKVLAKQQLNEDERFLLSDLVVNTFSLTPDTASQFMDETKLGLFSQYLSEIHRSIDQARAAITGARLAASDKWFKQDITYSEKDLIDGLEKKGRFSGTIRLDSPNHLVVVVQIAKDRIVSVEQTEVVSNDIATITATFAVVRKWDGKSFVNAGVVGRIPLSREFFIHDGVNHIYTEGPAVVEHAAAQLLKGKDVKTVLLSISLSPGVRMAEQKIEEKEKKVLKATIPYGVRGKSGGFLTWFADHRNNPIGNLSDYEKVEIMLPLMKREKPYKVVVEIRGEDFERYRKPIEITKEIAEAGKPYVVTVPMQEVLEALVKTTTNKEKKTVIAEVHFAEGALYAGKELNPNDNEEKFDIKGTGVPELRLIPKVLPKPTKELPKESLPEPVSSVEQSKDRDSQGISPWVAAGFGAGALAAAAGGALWWHYRRTKTIREKTGGLGARMAQRIEPNQASFKQWIGNQQALIEVVTKGRTEAGWLRRASESGIILVTGKHSQVLIRYEDMQEAQLVQGARMAVVEEVKELIHAAFGVQNIETTRFLENAFRSAPSSKELGGSVYNPSKEVSGRGYAFDYGAYNVALGVYYGIDPTLVIEIGRKNPSGRPIDRSPLTKEEIDAFRSYDFRLRERVTGNQSEKVQLIYGLDGPKYLVLRLKIRGILTNVFYGSVNPIIQYTFYGGSGLDQEEWWKKPSTSLTGSEITIEAASGLFKVGKTEEDRGSLKQEAFEAYRALEDFRHVVKRKLQNIFPWWKFLKRGAKSEAMAELDQIESDIKGLGYPERVLSSSSGEQVQSYIDDTRSLRSRLASVLIRYESQGARLGAASATKPADFSLPQNTAARGARLAKEDLDLVVGAYLNHDAYAVTLPVLWLNVLIRQTKLLEAAVKKATGQDLPDLNLNIPLEKQFPFLARSLAMEYQQFLIGMSADQPPAFVRGSSLDAVEYVKDVDQVVRFFERRQSLPFDQDYLNYIKKNQTVIKEQVPLISGKGAIFINLGFVPQLIGSPQGLTLLKLTIAHEIFQRWLLHETSAAERAFFESFFSEYKQKNHGWKKILITWMPQGYERQFDLNEFWTEFFAQIFYSPIPGADRKTAVLRAEIISRAQKDSGIDIPQIQRKLESGKVNDVVQSIRDLRFDVGGPATEGARMAETQKPAQEDPTVQKPKRSFLSKFKLVLLTIVVLSIGYFNYLSWERYGSPLITGIDFSGMTIRDPRPLITIKYGDGTEQDYKGFTRMPLTRDAFQEAIKFIEGNMEMDPDYRIKQKDPKSKGARMAAAFDLAEVYKVLNQYPIWTSKLNELPGGFLTALPMVTLAGQKLDPPTFTVETMLTIFRKAAPPAYKRLGRTGQNVREIIDRLLKKRYIVGTGGIIKGKKEYVLTPSGMEYAETAAHKILSGARMAADSVSAAVQFISQAREYARTYGNLQDGNLQSFLQRLNEIETALKGSKIEEGRKRVEEARKYIQDLTPEQLGVFGGRNMPGDLLEPLLYEVLESAYRYLPQGARLAHERYAPYADIAQMLEADPNGLRYEIVEELKGAGLLTPVQIDAAGDYLDLLDSLFTRMRRRTVGYHSHAHNLGTVYTNLLLSIPQIQQRLQETGDRQEAVKNLIIAFLGPWFHDLHVRTSQDSPASVKETMEEINFFLGDENAKPQEPAFREFGEHVRAEYQLLRVLLLGAEEAGKAIKDPGSYYTETIASIKRTDFPSDVKLIPPSFKASGDLRTKMVKELRSLADQFAAGTASYSEIQQQIAQLGASIEGTIDQDFNRLSGASPVDLNKLQENRKEVSETLRRVLDIEANYLAALDRVSVDRRPMIHQLALTLETADQTGYYVLLRPDAVNAVVEALKQENVQASAEGTFALFMFGQLLDPNVLNRLTVLPTPLKKNFVEVVDYYFRIAEKTRANQHFLFNLFPAVFSMTIDTYKNTDDNVSKSRANILKVLGLPSDLAIISGARLAEVMEAGKKTLTAEEMQKIAEYRKAIGQRLETTHNKILREFEEVLKSRLETPEYAYLNDTFIPQFKKMGHDFPEMLALMESTHITTTFSNMKAGVTGLQNRAARIPNLRSSFRLQLKQALSKWIQALQEAEKDVRTGGGVAHTTVTNSGPETRPDMPKQDVYPLKPSFSTPLPLDPIAQLEVDSKALESELIRFANEASKYLKDNFLDDGTPTKVPSKSSLEGFRDAIKFVNSILAGIDGKKKHAASWRKKIEAHLQKLEKAGFKKQESLLKKFRASYGHFTGPYDKVFEDLENRVRGYRDVLVTKKMALEKTVELEKQTVKPVSAASKKPVKKTSVSGWYRFGVSTMVGISFGGAVAILALFLLPVSLSLPLLITAVAAGVVSGSIFLAMIWSEDSQTIEKYFDNTTLFLIAPFWGMVAMGGIWIAATLLVYYFPSLTIGFAITKTLLASGAAAGIAVRYFLWPLLVRVWKWVRSSSQEKQVSTSVATEPVFEQAPPSKEEKFVWPKPTSFLYPKADVKVDKYGILITLEQPIPFTKKDGTNGQRREIKRIRISDTNDVLKKGDLAPFVPSTLTQIQDEKSEGKTAEYYSRKGPAFAVRLFRDRVVLQDLRGRAMVFPPLSPKQLKKFLNQRGALARHGLEKTTGVDFEVGAEDPVEKMYSTLLQAAEDSGVGFDAIDSALQFLIEHPGGSFDPSQAEPIDFRFVSWVHQTLGEKDINDTTFLSALRDKINQSRLQELKERWYTIQENYPVRDIAYLQPEELDSLSKDLKELRKETRRFTEIDEDWGIKTYERLIDGTMKVYKPLTDPYELRLALALAAAAMKDKERARAFLTSKADPDPSKFSHEEARIYWKYGRTLVQSPEELVKFLQDNKFLGSDKMEDKNKIRIAVAVFKKYADAFSALRSERQKPIYALAIKLHPEDTADFEEGALGKDIKKTTVKVTSIKKGMVYYTRVAGDGVSEEKPYIMPRSNMENLIKEGKGQLHIPILPQENEFAGARLASIEKKADQNLDVLKRENVFRGATIAKGQIRIVAGIDSRTGDLVFIGEDFLDKEEIKEGIKQNTIYPFVIAAPHNDLAKEEALKAVQGYKIISFDEVDIKPGLKPEWSGQLPINVLRQYLEETIQKYNEYLGFLGPEGRPARVESGVLSPGQLRSFNLATGSYRIIFHDENGHQIGHDLSLVFKEGLFAIGLPDSMAPPIEFADGFGGLGRILSQPGDSLTVGGSKEDKRPSLFVKGLNPSQFTFLYLPVGGLAVENKNSVGKVRVTFKEVSGARMALENKPELEETEVKQAIQKLLGLGTVSNDKPAWTALVMLAGRLEESETASDLFDLLERNILDSDKRKAFLQPLRRELVRKSTTSEAANLDRNVRELEKAFDTLERFVQESRGARLAATRPSTASRAVQAPKGARLAEISVAQLQSLIQEYESADPKIKEERYGQYGVLIKETGISLNAYYKRKNLGKNWYNDDLILLKKAIAGIQKNIEGKTTDLPAVSKFFAAVTDLDRALATIYEIRGARLASHPGLEQKTSSTETVALGKISSKLRSEIIADIVAILHSEFTDLVAEEDRQWSDRNYKVWAHKVWRLFKSGKVSIEPYDLDISAETIAHSIFKSKNLPEGVIQRPEIEIKDYLAGLNIYRLLAEPSGNYYRPIHESQETATRPNDPPTILPFSPQKVSDKTAYQTGTGKVLRVDKVGMDEQGNRSFEELNAVVLVVDDESSILDFARTIFPRLLGDKYDYVLAKNLDEGQHVFDLIKGKLVGLLTDIEYPKGNVETGGKEAGVYLAEKAAESGIPVSVMSGRSGEPGLKDQSGNQIPFYGKPHVGWGAFAKLVKDREAAALDSGARLAETVSVSTSERVSGLAKKTLPAHSQTRALANQAILSESHTVATNIALSQRSLLSRVKGVVYPIFIGTTLTLLSFFGTQDAQAASFDVKIVPVQITPKLILKDFSTVVFENSINFKEQRVKSATGDAGGEASAARSLNISEQLSFLPMFHRGRMDNLWNKLSQTLTNQDENKTISFVIPMDQLLKNGQISSIDLKETLRLLDSIAKEKKTSFILFLSHKGDLSDKDKQTLEKLNSKQTNVQLLALDTTNTSVSQAIQISLETNNISLNQISKLVIGADIKKDTPESIGQIQELKDSTYLFGIEPADQTQAISIAQIIFTGMATFSNGTLAIPVLKLEKIETPFGMIYVVRPVLIDKELRETLLSFQNTAVAA